MWRYSRVWPFIRVRCVGFLLLYNAKGALRLKSSRFCGHLQEVDGLNADYEIFWLFGVLVSALIVEGFAPWRREVRRDYARMLRNASMLFYATIMLSLLPALASFGAAVAAEAQGVGLMNLFSAPLWVKIIVAILMIDFLFYVQHRMLHQWYFLWRTHRTHHSDIHIDATTALRFHPLEVLFRAVTEAGFVMLMGLPPEGVLASYAVHAFANTLTHANIHAPQRVERIASLVFVTPRVHRLHHSTAPEHLHKNFGTTLTAWDRLFGTYISLSALKHDAKFGLDGPENIGDETFGALVLDPFRTPDGAAIPSEGGKVAEKAQSV